MNSTFDVIAMAHLSFNVGDKVIGEEVVVASSRYGFHHGFKKVVPAKGSLPNEVGYSQKTRIQLHEDSSKFKVLIIG